MGILKPITEWATSPWGKPVPIHIAWFLIWVAVANAIYTTYFGYGSPASIEQFLRDLFTTSAGWKLIPCTVVVPVHVPWLGVTDTIVPDVIGSVTCTLAAADGPRLVTVTV